MSHPEIDNTTAFAVELLYLLDESGRTLAVPLVQAVYAIDGEQHLHLLPKQPAPDLAGTFNGPDPALSSVRLEPQIAFTKLSTDVVLLGHAVAAAQGVTESRVGIRVGSMQKLAKVFGDRRLVRHRGALAITPPAVFQSIPLIYERAFGGWDRRHENPELHCCESRNPVGTGFRDKRLPPDPELPLPNFEDSGELFSAYGDTPTPTGFGFVGANWQPRVGFAGTYDKTWNETRKPLLPADFDRRFFNGASPGLIAPQYLRGNESVIVIGMTPEGRAAFDLPGGPPPECVIELRRRDAVLLPMHLDTVLVDMDAAHVTMQWRGHLPLPTGPHDISGVALRPGAQTS